MKKDDALEMAFDELGDVQFCDNDWRAARREKAEVKEILRRLAERLTKRATDVMPCGHHESSYIGNPPFCTECVLEQEAASRR